VTRRVDDREPDYPLQTVPGDRRGNGKRWFADTLGKAIAGVLTVMFLGLLALIATGRAYTIYGLPPRVDALEAKVYAPPPPMPQAEIDRLAAAIAAALPSPAPRKTKP
jgi:hypothetical protein